MLYYRDLRKQKSHPNGWLSLKLGAGDEIRTRDLLVGNEKLYH